MSDKFQPQRDSIAAHREYLDGCEKRAQSKYQALLAVARAARAVGLEGPKLTLMRALRDALAKLDEAES